MTERKRGIFIGACAALTLLSAAAIILFSGQSGSQSDGLSKCLAAWVLSLLPMDETAENLALLNRILRKLAHFGLYFLLGLGLTGTAGRQKRVPSALVVIVLGGLFAWSDEFHQGFSPGRSPSGRDVALDVCGVAAGWAVLELLRRRKGKRAAKA